jgi:hypothetical protein
MLYTGLGYVWVTPDPALTNASIVIVVVGLVAVEFSNVKSGNTLEINAKWSPVGSETSNSEEAIYAFIGWGVPV